MIHPHIAGESASSINAASPEVDINNASNVPERIFLCSYIGTNNSAVPQPGTAPNIAAIIGCKGPERSTHLVNLFFVR